MFNSNLINNLAYHESLEGHRQFHSSIRGDTDGCLSTDDFCTLAYELRINSSSLDWYDCARELVGYTMEDLLSGMFPSETEPITREELVKLDLTEKKPIVDSSIDEIVEHIKFLQNLIVRAKNGIKQDQSILLDKESVATAEELKKLNDHLGKFKPIQILDSTHKIADDPIQKVMNKLSKKGIDKDKLKKMMNIDLDDI